MCVNERNTCDTAEFKEEPTLPALLKQVTGQKVLISA